MRCLNSVLLLLAAAVTCRAADPLPLEESVVVEAVNDVTHIAMPTGRAEPATVSSHLKAPDRLRTGRASRAELEAPDGTITRLGANTVFAFDRASRAMQLERGSVLFHSPTGRGGGKIQSPSASAAVLGTTIIAAATNDGGFKLLVLEGRAQVDFTAGARLQLNAGQMTFVRPGQGGVGTPGPVLNFDLAQQVRHSRLVQGFSRPLPSRSKIDQAMQSQQRAVGQGQFVATGFLVFAATSDTQVNGIEASGPDSDNQLVGEFTAAQRIALNTDATLTTSRIPAERVFRTELLVPKAESDFLNQQSDVLITGLLARSLTITAPTISLLGWDLPAFHFVGKNSITFTESTTFTDLGGLRQVRLFSPVITVPAGTTLLANFPIGVGSTFYFDAELDLVLSGNTIRNTSGGLILQSHNGALRLVDTTLDAGGRVGADTVVPSAINLDVPRGALSFSGGLIKTSGSGLAALGITITGSGTRFELGGNFWADATNTAQLDHLTWGPLPANAVFQLTAGTLVSLSSLNFDGFQEINLGARTIALDGVHFASGTTVRLVSEQGRLAPLPNTGQTVQPGLVNFVRDVTYAGNPAQDYVSADVGGTGVQPTSIIVSKPVP